ncbi:MAG TPA: NAD(P) transhydrogenase subunit alpha [Saprospiraceae bacterium]|nr:NAD(P) transhydrogenase subunit alpha [Saprospiraceae bacterium]
MESFLNFFQENILSIYLMVFAVFLGFELISKVPTVLHTPLMSGANAISGIVLVGSILFLRQTDPDNYISLSIGSIAVIMATINIVGGFAVTNRMLAMFKKDKKS